MTDKRRSRDPGLRRRTFWALSGFFVPKAGDQGWLGSPEYGRDAEVTVTRVSATGKTVWVRFVGERDDLARGQEAEYSYWYEPALGYYLSDDSAWAGSRRYLADGSLSDSPPGRLCFR